LSLASRFDHNVAGGDRSDIDERKCNARISQWHTSCPGAHGQLSIEHRSPQTVSIWASIFAAIFFAGRSQRRLRRIALHTTTLMQQYLCAEVMLPISDWQHHAPLQMSHAVNITSRTEPELEPGDWLARHY
jgi:hypothetical protein